MESNQFVPFPQSVGRDVPTELLPETETGGSAGGAVPLPRIPFPGYGESGQTPGLEAFPEPTLPGGGAGAQAEYPEPAPGISISDLGENELAGIPVPIPGIPFPATGEEEAEKSPEPISGNVPAVSGGSVSAEVLEQNPVPHLPARGAGGGGTSAEPAQAYIRFLNAVVDDGPSLRITLGSRLLVTRLAPGNLTAYTTAPAGFRTLVFYDAQFPWVILYRSSLSLAADEVVTLAVVRSGGGIDVVRVDDRPCGGAGGRACLRMINLVYDSPGLDLVLTDGRVVFTDIRFKEDSAYRRARPGRYDMYVAQTPCAPHQNDVDIETVEEMPVMISNYFLAGCGVVEPMASFYLEARLGARDSIYLMGNWNRSPRMQVRVVENI